MNRLLKLFFTVLLLNLAWGIFGPQLPGGSRSQKQAARSQIIELKKGIAHFRVDCKRFPATTEGLLALVLPPGAMRGEELWRGPYLYSIQNDPWGRSYFYKYPGQHNTNGYDVYTLGPNGVGGDEAIGNWTALPSQ